MENKTMIRQEKLNIIEYEEAFAIPGAQRIINVYDRNGNFVPYTSKRRYGKAEYSVPDTPIQIREDEFEYYDEDVVYLGFLRGHWGHFIVDSTVRFWALLREECGGKRILLTIEGMEAFCYQLFEKLGIDKNRLLFLDRKARFRKILVPELSYFPGKYVTKEYLEPFEKVASVVELDRPVYDKIYLSRVRFSRGKKELGEESIEDIFAANGFRILYPEELSFEEQVWYYKNCKVMVTTNGTVAHNVVYAGNDVELIVLKRFPEENVHQYAMNLVKGIKVTYLNAYDKHSDHDNCLMRRTPEVVAFCRERNMQIPKESFWKRTSAWLIFRLPYIYRWCK